MRGWQTKSQLVALLAFFTLLGFVANFTKACDTPVYRYAMYRWKPQPYEVYAFHKKPITGAAAQLRQSINQLIDGKKNPANLAYIPVDVTRDPELKTIPEQVRDQYKAIKSEDNVVYVVYSPVGSHLFSGKITVKDLKSLVDSKARQALTSQLAAGKTGVLVLLRSKDKKANELARQTIQSLRKQVRSGKISLVPGGSSDEKKKKPATKSKSDKEFGLVEVDRTDPKEAWFVRSLVGVEKDLKSLDKPMVFTVYGRARAIPPCIDKGITVQNLARELTFIAGACSCTIKEQNPGVDLLVRFDWDKAAATIAEKFGAEEGNEKQIGSSEFFPDLLIPGTEPSDKKSETKNPQVAKKSDPDNNGEKIDTDQVVSPSNAETTSTDQKQDPSSNAKAGPGKSEKGKATTQKQLASAAPNATKNVSKPESGQNGFYGFWVILGGLGVGLVVLFGATFFVLRR